MIIIDGGYLTARSRHVFGNLTNSAGTPTGAVYGFLSTIKQIRRGYPEHQIVICLDSYSQWRSNLSNQYKATRESHQEGWLGSDKQIQHSFEKEAIKKIVSNIDNVRVIEAEEAEADDLIAILASENPGAAIFSADKDMWQLTQFSTVITFKMEKGKLIIAEYPKEFENIPPQNLALYRAIMGDTSDGIPKIPRVSTKEVSEMAMTYSTPNDLRDNPLDNKSYNIIMEHWEQLLTNYELCKLPPNRRYNIMDYKAPMEEAVGLIETLELNSMRGLLE